MLISGKVESTAPLKIDETFLEFCTPSQVEACPSPRVLDSHLPFNLLPKQLKGNISDILGRDLFDHDLVWACSMLALCMHATRHLLLFAINDILFETISHKQIIKPLIRF